MSEPNGKPDTADPARTLEEVERKVKLLVDRHRALAGAYSEMTASMGDGGDGLDPAELEEVVRSLRSERDRLARHAEFLESRVRELLTRARYAAGI